MDNARLGKLALVSRDEYKQAQHREEYSVKPWAGLLRYILADVRDDKRIARVIKDADYVIHAAALKRVEAMTYNPDEAVSTNVLGTLNVARACVEAKVRRAVFLSTDKAVYPINTYGRTKAVAEDLWRSFNFHRPIFTVARYGNVMGSRGSVVERYNILLAAGRRSLPVFDPTATRFWLTPKYACELACAALEDSPGITIVSKARSFLVGDLAAILSLDPPTVTGLRPNEKRDEVMITRYEAERTYDAKRWYRMAPELSYDDKINYNPQDQPSLYPGDLDSTADIMSRNELKVALEAL